MQGIKHLVQCHCMLPQMKAKSILHKFVVFSTIDDDDQVKVKFAQCNNCGVIHKVVDICKSVVLDGRENLSSILTIDDIKVSLQPDLKMVLERAEADLATWEQAKFIVENKRWGEFIVLSSTIEDGLKQVKYVTIIGENLCKVETYTKEVE